MERLTIPFTTEADWLGHRMQDITSTEVSALFGCSPYMTPFELFHLKRGDIESSFEANERMKWGNRLEAAIATGVAEDLNLTVEPFKDYMRIPELRMGSSFDYKVFCPDRGIGLMEVKNVDGLIFRRGWISGEEAEAPPHIELQVQHEMEVANLDYNIIAALIGGNTPQVMHRERDPRICNAIVAKVAEFWGRMARNDPYPPDYMADGKTIAMLNAMSAGETIDLIDDDELAELAAKFNAVKNQLKAVESEEAALKAAIQHKIWQRGGKENAIVEPDDRKSYKVALNGFEISMPNIKESKGTFITPNMVGTYIGGRAGHRRFSVKPASLR